MLRRLGIALARRWLDEMKLGAGAVIPLASDHEAAMATVARYPDQPITLFDAVLSVLSERLGAPVWTYDRHFDVMAANVWHLPH